MATVRLSNSGNLTVNNLVVDGLNNAPRLGNNTVVHNLKEGQSLGTNTKMRWKNNEMLLAGQAVANNASLGTVNVNGNLSVNNCSLVPIGTIIMWAGSLIPEGWAKCDGSLVNNNLFPGLFAALVNNSVYPFGGSNENSFNLPNFNTRFPRGASTNLAVGNFVDNWNHIHEFPNHNHNFVHNHNLDSHDHSLDHSHQINHYHELNHTHNSDHLHSISSHSHTMATNSVTTGGYGSSLSGTYFCGNHTHSSRSSDNASLNTYAVSGNFTNVNSGLSSIEIQTSSSNLGCSNVVNDYSAGECNGEFNSSSQINSQPNNPPYLGLYFIIRVK